MFVYSWTLALVYLATVPLYALLMRFSATRLRPMYDNLEEAYGKYQSAQIDAIRGIETVKALAAEQAFRGLMLRQFQGLADRVFRSQFLVMVYQGGAAARHVRVLRPVPVRRRARGRARGPVARPVRLLQRADRARERAAC